jgi:DNA invertase Pin-like site-specific DNA recombinase
MGGRFHKPRAALYHRVSSLDPSPTATARELRQAALRLGMRVALAVEEQGSGASNDRPGLLRVMEAARAGKVDAVLVWKLDRFGRSALDLLALLGELDAAAIRFVAVSQQIDIRPGSDETSRLPMAMLRAVAEFERTLISERTRAGIEKARLAGVRLGRPRVPRPPARRVRALKAAGKTWAQIADELGCTVWAAREAARAGARKG